MKQFRFLPSNQTVELFETRTDKVLDSIDAEEIVSEREFRYFEGLACFHKCAYYVNYQLPGSNKTFTHTIDEANDRLADAYLELGEKAADAFEAARQKGENSLESIIAEAVKISDASFGSTNLDDPDIGMKLDISSLAKLVKNLAEALAAKA